MKRQRQRGAAMVEFAVSFALLWLVIAGAAQFGYAMYVYNALASSVANAARSASLLEVDARNTSSVNTWKQNIRDLVVYGAAAGDNRQAIVPGLATNHVTVDFGDFVGGRPETIRVGITGYNLNAMFNSINLTNKPQVTMRFSGDYLAP